MAATASSIAGARACSCARSRLLRACAAQVLRTGRCRRRGAQEEPGCTNRDDLPDRARGGRSEEHTSELQSLMRISYAVFCLKKKKKHRSCEHTRYAQTIPTDT